MLKTVGAAKVAPLHILLVFLLLFISGSVSVNAETASVDENSDAKNRKTQPLFRNYLRTPESESEYPLFREHAERYYPALDPKKASRLSTFMPGLGQAYAGRLARDVRVRPLGGAVGSRKPWQGRQGNHSRRGGTPGRPRSVWR